MKSTSAYSEERIDAFDERIESVTDELVATELLHEAAVLAGDVLPESGQTSPTEDAI